MNCCGNKRKEWMNEVKSSNHQDMNENVPDTLIEDKPDRVFEYSGKYSQTFIGAVTGKSYQFRFNGEKLKVDYSDTFAMMAERDLMISSEQTNAERL
jgi:hypothetical protein